ncbi:hypothetical protein J5N97_022157 [Dioscorea zingiberensis]|uniref:DUF761 domain-containing protein n=1 Tax=Dioscorea zingiberensis TaxID=325984 RepID=A0A9D5CBD5_9LILI|nr:hypothetical protein J5N97_022157 [Dioscorea zingiberensis]
MKGSATAFFKQVFSVLVTMVKAKSVALKGKTSALKTRLIIFGLLQNKRVLLSAISHKIHALIGEEKEKEKKQEDCNRSDGDHSCNEEALDSSSCQERDENTDVTEYLQLEEDEDIDEGEGSVLDFARSFQKNDLEFNLENEIDQAADMFIKRFHRQMQMQKQESFKRYQEMMERSV